jgi:hypothetical protein
VFSISPSFFGIFHNLQFCIFSLILTTVFFQSFLPVPSSFIPSLLSLVPSFTVPFFLPSFLLFSYLLLPFVYFLFFYFSTFYSSRIFISTFLFSALVSLFLSCLLSLCIIRCRSSFTEHTKRQMCDWNKKPPTYIQSTKCSKATFPCVGSTCLTFPFLKACGM